MASVRGHFDAVQAIWVNHGCHLPPETVPRQLLPQLLPQQAPEWAQLTPPLRALQAV